MDYAGSAANDFVFFNIITQILKGNEIMASFKKFFSILLSLCMVLALMPTSAFAAGSSSSVDHIDLGVSMTAELKVGDKTLSSEVKLKTSDASRVQVTAVQNGSAVSFTRTSVSTSTDTDGNPQVRLKGTFPVGTKSNPVVYTVSFTTDVTFVDGSKTYTVPMTFTSTFNYWSSDNVCPGLTREKSKWMNGSVIRGSGMDFVLGSSASKGIVTIAKEVKDKDGNYINPSGQTFTFNVYRYDAGSKSYTKVDAVTVQPTGDGIGIGVVYLDYGTYYIEEASPVSELTVDNENYEYNGTAITYTDAAGTKNINGTKTENFNLSANAVKMSVSVANIYAPGTTSVAVSKEWNDAGNQDGIRPSSVTVRLYADGKPVDGKTATLNADNSWEATFENLPVYKSGTAIAYTVVEDEVTDYTTSVSGNAEDGFVVTNSHTPAKTSVTVTKSWDDAGNQDGIRPASVTAVLYADGVSTDKKVTLSAANQWSARFTDLPVNKAGKKIAYTVKEELEEGSKYTAVVTGSADAGFVITNSYEPAKTDISVSKEWDDADNQDNLRPASVTVRLYADGNPVDGKTATLNAANKWTATFENLPVYKSGTAIVYTVVEDKVAGYTANVTGSAGEGFVVTNSHTPAKTSVDVSKVWKDAQNQDNLRPTSITVKLLANGTETGKTVELNANNKWAATFDNLDKNAAGVEIAYTVEEVSVTGYTSVITGSAAEGYVITNTHAPEKTSVAVSKVWADAQNQDNIRPDAVTVELLANGTETGKTVELNTNNNWAATFNNLDKNAAGVEIAYTVEEVSVTGYTSVITGSAAEGYVITNTHAPEKTSVAVSKVWADAQNQDNIRPDAVTVKLFANGTEVQGKTVELNAGNKWTASFTNLDKYAAGEIIRYTVEEVAIEGYEPVITGDQVNGYVITNGHIPYVTSVTVTKEWIDNQNQDNIRPDSVTVKLYADDEPVEGQELTLSEGNNWTATFSNLPVNKAGKKIEYTVEENAVDGYEATITGTALGGFTVKNTHVPATTEVSVSKVWDDADDQDNIRPDSVTVRLYADGEPVEGQTVTLSEENQWTSVFTELPKFKEGTEIVYTVVEDEVTGYTSEVSGTAEEGYVITNYHKPLPPDENLEPEDPKDPPRKPLPEDQNLIDEDVPYTGDATADALLYDLMILSISALAAILLKKRKSDNE